VRHSDAGWVRGLREWWWAMGVGGLAVGGGGQEGEGSWAAGGGVGGSRVKGGWWVKVGHSGAVGVGRRLAGVRETQPTPSPRPAPQGPCHPPTSFPTSKEMRDPWGSCSRALAICALARPTSPDRKFRPRMKRIPGVTQHTGVTHRRATHMSE
jgi:hypothetical protein